MNPVTIYLAVEDDLSEEVARKVLSSSRQTYLVGAVYGKSGFGFLKKNALGFNRAAQGIPYLMLTDLDQGECAPDLMKEWFGEIPLHPNFLFRVAVREVEAWLLAHRKAFAKFVRISESRIPKDVESIADPKQSLIQLVSRSPNRAMREEIMPPAGSIRKQGPNYNGCLAGYVQKFWNPREAMRSSDSLSRMVKVLDDFSL